MGNFSIATLVGIMSRLFTCAQCGYTYNTSSTQEEIESEYTELYGHSLAESDEDNLSVCDDCSDEILKNIKKRR